MTLRTRALWPLRIAVHVYDDRQWARMNPNQQAEALHHVAVRQHATRSPEMAMPTDTAPDRTDYSTTFRQQRQQIAYGEPTIGELLALWFLWVPLALLLAPLILMVWGIHDAGRAAWRLGRQWMRA